MASSCKHVKKKRRSLEGIDTKTNESSIQLNFQTQKTNNGYSITTTVGSKLSDLSNLNLAIAFVCDVSGSMNCAVTDSNSSQYSHQLAPALHTMPNIGGGNIPPPPPIFGAGGNIPPPPPIFGAGVNIPPPIPPPARPMLTRMVSVAPQGSCARSAVNSSYSHVGIDTHTRIGVLTGSMKRIFKLFSKYASRGAKITISLAVFSDNYEIFLNNEQVGPDFLENFLPNISQQKWFALRGGTNFSAAIKAKNIFTKNFTENFPKSKQLTFLASDGYHSESKEVSRASLLNSKNFDITLCVGDNVDEELMKHLGHQTDFGTDERTLQNCLEGRVFEQSAEIAKNLSFRFKNHDKVITPLESKDGVFKLNHVRPGHLIPMYYDSLDDEEIQVIVSYDTPAGNNISFEMDFIADCTSSLKTVEACVVETYSKTSIMLNSLTSDSTISREKRTEEFRKIHENITKLESLLTKENCSHNISELLVSFKQHLDKARECQSNDAQYLALLRQTSRGMSQVSQPLSLMRETSSSVIDHDEDMSKSVDEKVDEEKLLCKICFEKKSAVIIRPCNHFFGCENCIATHVHKNNDCPVCRIPIQSIRKFELISTKCLHSGCTKDVDSVFRECNHAYMCKLHAIKLMTSGTGCLHCTMKISRVQPITVS